MIRRILEEPPDTEKQPAGCNMNMASEIRGSSRL